MFLEPIETVKKLEGSTLVKDEQSISKERIEANLRKSKIALDLEFNSLTNFPKNEIRKWLVDFVKDNVEHLVVAPQ